MLDLLDSGQLPDPLSNASVPAEVTSSITHPKGEAR